MLLYIYLQQIGFSQMSYSYNFIHGINQFSKIRTLYNFREVD